MATENKASPSYFVSKFLANPATNIPKGAQWTVMFHELGNILPTIDAAYQREPLANSWKITRAASIVTGDDFQKTKGCMFCQAIALPGDGMTAVAEGIIKSNAYIRGYVGGGRNDFPLMRMTFLETNVSFCDSFLRGWALATANFGMIARDDKPYRTNLTCWKFGITPQGPIILQTMSFQDICCVDVSEEEYNYDPSSAAVKREAQFVYNSYSIDSETGNNF